MRLKGRKEGERGKKGGRKGEGGRGKGEGGREKGGGKEGEELIRGGGEEEEGRKKRNHLLGSWGIDKGKFNWFFQKMTSFFGFKKCHLFLGGINKKK